MAFRNHALGTAGILGRKHADTSADVGVPDIAVGIDSEAIGPGVVGRKPECCDPAVAQAAKTRIAHHSEPDGSIPLRPAFCSATLKSESSPLLCRPMRLARNCKNHTEPSVPTATSVGTAPGCDKSIV